MHFFSTLYDKGPGDENSRTPDLQKTHIRSRRCYIHVTFWVLEACPCIESVHASRVSYTCDILGSGSVSMHRSCRIRVTSWVLEASSRIDRGCLIRVTPWVLKACPCVEGVISVTSWVLEASPCVSSIIMFPDSFRAQYLLDGCVIPYG